MFKYSRAYIAKLLKGIYEGKITEHDLPENLYHAIAEHLTNGVYKGYGIDIDSLTKQINEGASKFTKGDLELLTDLRENIYMFSAAKTYQQVKEMTEKLIDEDGVIRSFSEFKADATEIFDTYNKDYLKTEYDTAIGQSMMAVKWENIEREKDILPFLEYDTIGDACDICAPLDGLVASVDDPIWDEVSPLNHFNCECLLSQLDEEEGTEKLTPDDEKEEAFDSATEKMNDTFKMNPGKDGVVFSEDHPYFNVPKEDKGFARKNFDLPIPEND